MKNHVLRLWILFALLIFVSDLTAQDGGKYEVVAVGPEVAAVALIQQPNCPLHFTEIETYVMADGSRPLIRYVVRNESNKQVSSLQVSFIKRTAVREWSNQSHGFADYFGRATADRTLIQQDLDFTNIDPSNLAVLPSTSKVDELIARRTTNDSVKILWIGIITKVVFLDGSTYDASEIARKIEDLMP